VPPAAALREAGALLVRPALELGHVAEKESVEEGAGVEREGVGEVVARAALERRLELADVARHQPGVEAKRAAVGHEGALGKVAAKRVEQLGEGVARPLGVALRPETGDDLVAAHAARMGRREQGEEGQASPLGRGAGERALTPFDREGPEGPEPEHAGPDEASGATAQP